MKVKDLIKMLKGHEHKDIYFSQDEEGNGIMEECDVELVKSSIVLYPYRYTDRFEFDDEE